MTGPGPVAPGLVVAASGEGLATMWRIELLHPATIHFSVALTLVGTLFWLVGALARRWPRLAAFDLVGCVTLILAAIAAWVAVQTGFWADEVVGRELYDPRPLKDHENAGVTLAWIMTAAVGVDLLRRLRFVPIRWRQVAWVAVAFTLLGGSGLVVYTSHLGASLVYQQGAGVIAPPED